MSRTIVFVAGDVGGLGGMEHQSEQLILHLLDAGVAVTVIARTCELPPHKQLRFVRVRTPKRPFAIAYPAFIAIASFLAARRRGALLHTTGAVVINRVDVSTVHYCHRAAKARLTGSRAARSNRAYRLNAWLAGAMSRAAEAWCYRPARTRVLCAVSQGVATELGEQFPGMRGAIRAIPNGVDANRFAPDSAVRDRVRAEFGIQQQEAVALFAGGDWERKGLIHAVGALENAPQWRLLVAGPGDPTPVLAAARSVGTEPRVQFLGPVSDMPSLYAAADAFVLPTSYEAFPLVVLEAAASALPLLVTRVNGVEEALDDGRNGWFVDRRADDIARRLNELAADRPLATAMAAAARKAALAYSWGSMAEQYLSLYAELGLSPD